MDAVSLPIKVGPWGGSTGNPFDITEGPKRLESLTIRSGAVVNSFGFSYVDEAGQKHTVGPVGSNGGGKLTTIQFAPTEYVKEFSGSVGPTKGTWVVTYLKIETNLQIYEIYDDDSLFQSVPAGKVPFVVPMPEKEVPFSIPLPENTSIVGFFGRASDNLEAIGVYVKSSNAENATQETTFDLDEYSPEKPIYMVAEVVPIKIGTWGGKGGKEFDLTEPPKCLESMNIRAGDSVDSIGFSYVDETGEEHNEGPFGGTGGQLATIQFAPAEYVKKFSGTIGRSMSFVASLEIETNIKTYGPYGKAYSKNPFSIPLPEDVGVVGFFGRAGKLLDAIGVYIGYTKYPFTIPTKETSSSNKNEETSKNKDTTPTITGQALPIKIGIWGGGGGAKFDVIEPPKYLDSMMIRSGDIVDSFGFSYMDQAGQKHTLGPYGGNGGNLTTIKLEPSEYVMNFSGTTGTYVGSPVIASLAIETNLREYGPYGKEQDDAVHFSIPLIEDNASIVGFFGSAGNRLDAIGVYVNGSIPN